MIVNTIGMISSYSGLTQCDWLWKQTPVPFGRWEGIQISAPSLEPDWLLLYQYNFLPATPIAPAKTWRSRLKSWLQRSEPVRLGEAVDPYRGVPKERRLYLLREPPLPEVRHKNQRSYAMAKQQCGYVSGPDQDAPQPAYMPAIWYVNVSFRELEQMSAPLKEKDCSWITSGISRTENHRRRLAFLQQLQASGVPFDLYGRRLPAWAKTLGDLENKWHGMAPYYYNLAIENYADNDWYVSEKLWDALLSWCLPIYYGGGAADKLLPPGSFLRLPSLDAKGIQYIREVTATPDYWYAAQAAIAEARQIILHELNLLNWLSNYVKQQGG